ncbi:hypothetical protein [Alicyclobacillus sp. ALC3]|uniref:hypothetical protein n=1 Tax=Alicyclobacillus sp. ALC3 TaxID=2796143 RepID=UPI0023785339|nr:hypothetical protein [Alicyclobacillus sp. ALC3]WDL98583.1 hypothetical protein JC200_07900 [Alicyclobacillus sp. ALC3]
MSDRAGQSNHATRAQGVYATVTDVLDTVASFDGRFSFTPVNPAGHGTLSFAARDQGLELAVDVTYNAEVDHVRVTLTHVDPARPAAALISTAGATSAKSRVAPETAPVDDVSTTAIPDDDATSTSIVAYEGLLSATAIYYQLGAALAKWYGEVVRRQFGPTVGENEG